METVHRLKQGTTRDDGKVFLSYRKLVSGVKERWLSKDAYQRYKSQSRSWHTKDPDRARKQKAEWRAANPDKVRAISRKSHAAHKDKRNAASKAYCMRNPERFCAYAATRRALKRQTAHSLNETDKAISRAVYGASRRVSSCLGIPHHVDHIIPLAKGGAHHPSNLQVLPASINQKKHAKLPSEYATYQEAA